MKNLQLRFLLLLVFVLLATAASAAGQGVIVPGPCRRCPVPPPPVSLPRSLPIKSITIDTKISSQVATTRLVQVFRNDTNATLEGTYLFPIPEQASITEFASGKAIRSRSEVRSRKKRAAFRRDCRRQRDPGSRICREELVKAELPSPEFDRK